jgi:mannose-1-phosphate guanylyltransferase
MLHAMIMAGGGGTRFWPRSRQERPKQFLAIGSERTLLQQAFDRVEACALPIERVWIMTGASYVAQTLEQLPTLRPDRVIGEPTGRDTAACIGLGAALIHHADPEAIMVVTPADHVIEPTRLFANAVHVAESMIREHPGAIVTFGISPTFPATGYGYIHRGEKVATRQGINVHRVARFAEKPKLPQAEQFVASGEYDWNSGIFVWRAETVLKALATHKPGIHAAVMRIAATAGTNAFAQTLAREYPQIEKTSIDFAVMEHHKETLVVQAPYRWDDVGSWLAIERMQPQDASGNTVTGEHLGIATSNCVIVGEPGKMIATIGVEDLLIVQDGNCLLVAHRSREGEVKQVVEELRNRKQTRYL